MPACPEYQHDQVYPCLRIALPIKFALKTVRRQLAPFGSRLFIPWGTQLFGRYVRR